MLKALPILIILCKVSILFVESKSFIEDLTLTEEQKLKLDKFKELVIGRLPHKYMERDVYLIRWLRVGHYNIYDAEKKLMNNLKWREENQMDSIHFEDWSDMMKKYKYTHKIRSRDNKITLYINIGQWDIRRAAISGDSHMFNRYLYKIMDETYNAILEHGERTNNVSQGIMIQNIGGFNYVQHGCLQCIPVLLNAIRVHELHYPGVADKMIAINIPAVAENIVRASRSIFDKDTLGDVYCYGTNSRIWKKALSIDFTTDQLPVELGGTMEIDDNFEF